MNAQNASAGGLFDLLQGPKAQVAVSAAQAVEAVASQSRTGVNISDMIAESESRLANAVSPRTVTAETLAGIREEILLADLTSARESREKDRIDLGVAIVGLNETMNAIGQAIYTDFGQETDEEKAIVENAKARLERADSAQRMAGQKLAVAKTKLALFGIRKRAIASATSELATADRELQEARLAVPLAEERAKQLARERLQEANIDSTLDSYISMSNRLVGVMMQRRQETINEETIVSARRVAADEANKQASRILSETQAEVAQLEGNHFRLQDELALVQTKSPEYAVKEAEVRQASTLLEEARNKQNIALAIANSKAKFAEELALHEKALQRLRGNLQVWIASIQSDTEERLVTFRAVLQEMKMLDDQEVSANVDAVGAQMDQQNMMTASRAVVASDKARQAMMNAMPARRQKQAAVIESMRTHLAETRVRDAEFIAAFENKYGIDPKLAL